MVLRNPPTPLFSKGGKRASFDKDGKKHALPFLSGEKSAPLRYGRKTGGHGNIRVFHVDRRSPTIEKLMISLPIRCSPARDRGRPERDEGLPPRRALLEGEPFERIPLHRSLRSLPPFRGAFGDDIGEIL